MTQFFLGQQRHIYRSRSGMIFGVCKGLADSFNLKVMWVRIITLICFFCTGIWPTAIIYILAALLMKPEPILPLETEEAEEFYNSYVSSRGLALHRLKRTFDNLNRRIQRMESAVTAREYDWDRRLNEGV